MDVLAAVLAKLEQLKTEHAHAACSKPTGNEFDYGRVCGHYQGLSAALLAVEKILENADDEPEFEKKLRRGVPFDAVIDR